MIIPICPHGDKIEMIQSGNHYCSYTNLIRL